MNGIIIKKKKLLFTQILKLTNATMINGKAKDFCEKAGVSYPSMKAARDGKELSEQIIDKIIALL